MAISAAQLIGLVEIHGAEQSVAKLLTVSGTVDSLGAKLGLFAGGAALVAAAAFVGIGTVATKMASDFEQAKTLLVTSANELQSNLAMVGAGMLKMSVDVATPVAKLADAMFTVESAGYHGAAGLAVLKAAAEGAKVENADLTKVTQALTTTMHDWHLPASQAVDVMNSFREAAAVGNMKMDDFVGAMKNVGPVASLAKIKLSDVEGALSAMSLEGDKGASAGTHLAQSLLNMISPSTKAQKVLSEIGMTAQQVSDDMKKSLPATLAEITDAIGKKFPAGSAAYNHALSDMFGGTRGLKAILELTGQNLKDFTTDAAAIAPTMKANSTAVDGFALVQQNFNFKLDAAKNAISALLIEAGTQLLPVLKQLLDYVTPLIVSFTDWVTKSGILTIAMQDVVGAIKNTGSAIQNVVGFYQQWKPIIDTTATAIAFFFVPAVIAAGVEAVISGAKITYNFVAALIATGLNGWAAAAKLAVFIGSLVVTGAQAVIAGVALAVDFVGALITTSATAFATEFALTGSLIPALYAMGVAAFAALGPLGLLLGAVAAVTGALIWMKSVTDSTGGAIGVMTDSMGNKVQASTGRIIQSTENLKTGVTSSTDQMKNAVDATMQQMANSSIQSVQTLSDTATRLVRQTSGNVSKDMANMTQNTIADWNQVAAYVDMKSAQADLAGVKNIKHLSTFIRTELQSTADTSKLTMSQLATNIPASLSTMSTSATATVNTMSTDVSNAFDKVKSDAGTKVAAMGSDVTAKFTTIANNGRAQFANLASNIATGLTTAKSSVFSISSQMVAILSSAWRTAASQAYTGGINTGANFAAGLRSQVGNVASAANSLAAASAVGGGGGTAPHFASGIENFGGGMAYVHSGEVLTYLPPGTNVTPASKVASTFGSGPIHVHVHVDPQMSLDGRQLARGLMPYITDQIKIATGFRG